MTDTRFYSWHPCPVCGGTGFANTLNTEMHMQPVEYPFTQSEDCQDCGLDLCATFPAPDALPIVQIGPSCMVPVQEAIAWRDAAFARAAELEAVIRQGGDAYVVAAASTHFVIGKPSIPDRVPSCMREA